MSEESKTKSTPLHPSLGKDAEAAIQAELHEYLQEKGLNVLFQKMIQEILLAKPDNPIEFMLNFLTENYPDLAQAFKSKLSATSTNIESKELEEPEEDYSDDDEEEEDDFFDEAAEMKFTERLNKKSNLRRESVSAGVLNLNQKLDTLEFQVYEKTAEESLKLEEYLNKIIICSGLPTSDKKRIIDAFEKTFAPNESEIITQGDIKAEHYYIIGDGTAEVLKNGTKVLEYNTGDAFGELALMYNAPRAATVRATSDCSLWRLDQKVFKTILMANAMRDRDRRNKIVSSVPILKELGDREKQKIVEALKSSIIKKGEVICTQGEPGDEFFIISEGKVDVIVNDQEIGQLEEGEYFGEIALLTTKPRQATIKVNSETVTLLSVNRRVFQRVLGPLSDILKRNMKTYSEYVAGVRISA